MLALKALVQVILTPAMPAAAAASVAPHGAFLLPHSTVVSRFGTRLHFQYVLGPTVLAAQTAAALGLSASRVFGLLIPFCFQKELRLLNVLQALDPAPFTGSCNSC